MMDTFAGLALVIALFAGFALAWSCLKSIVTGWWVLRHRFADPFRTLPAAQALTMLRIGPDLRHGVGAVAIGVDDAGLHVRGRLPSGLCYRPLLFPWKMVDARGTVTAWWVGTWDTYGVGNYTMIGLPSRSKAAQLVRGYAQPPGEADHS